MILVHELSREGKEDEEKMKRVLDLGVKMKSRNVRKKKVNLTSATRSRVFKEESINKFFFNNYYF